MEDKTIIDFKYLCAYGNGAMLTIFLVENTIIYNFDLRSTSSSSTGAWSLDNKWTFTANGTLPVILTKFTRAFINNFNGLTAVVEQAINVKAVELREALMG